jgi:tetratricopeptide (TPR) repeat protein
MDRICQRHAAIVSWTVVAAVLACGAASAQPIVQPPPAGSAALRARALDLGYNLDHDEALAAFKAAIALDRSDPAPYRLVAATLWINLLFRQGAVLADDYLGQARSDLARTPPPPELAAAFQANLDKALALSAARVRANPAAADAHFQLGATHGFLATYRGTVEGRVLGAVGPARRAYGEHERALELDPARKDAGLIVGMYRYGVSTLPLPLRLLAGLAGFGGGRDRGLRLIEDAASFPSDVQPNAMFTLIVIYNREGRYGDAMRVIAELQRRYPRNRLLWLEAASTALRAGRPAEAKHALEEGLARFSSDPRPRAFGELARWHYYLGAALVALKVRDAAESELAAVLGAEAPEWLRGRAHKELGKLADLRGDRAVATVEYQTSMRICRAQKDTTCSDELGTLMRARR